MSRSLRLAFNPRGDLLAAARDCEADIFSQWFGNTHEQLAQEYEPYEANSVFLALADERDAVVACARILTSCRGPLKTIDDVQQPPWAVDAPRSAAAAGVDLARTWDIATMGVRPGLQADGVRMAFALYHGIITAVRVNNAAAIVAIVDERVRHLLASVGIVMQTLPGTEPAPYLGSPASAPVFARVSSSVVRQRRDFPDAYRLITLGVGLEDVRVPPRDHFRLPAPADPFRLQPFEEPAAPARQPAAARQLVGVAGPR